LATPNLFYEEETLAIDYAMEPATKSRFKKLISRKQEKNIIGMCDLDVVKHNMPKLLDRRNGSDDIVKLTCDKVQQQYETLTHAKVDEPARISTHL